MNVQSNMNILYLYVNNVLFSSCNSLKSRKTGCGNCADKRCTENGTALHSLLSGKTTVFKTTMCRDYTVCILLCHTEQAVKNIISLQKLEF